MSSNDVNLPEFPNIPWKLILRKLSGETTNEETKNLEDWVSADPLRNEFLDSLQTIWHNTGKLPMQVDVENIIKRVSEKAGFTPKPAVHPPSTKNPVQRFLPKTILRIAASIVLFVGLSYGVYELVGVKEQPALAMSEIGSQKGQRIQFRFNDGTKVTLNAASTIRFPQKAAKGLREVYLFGEAYFEVAHIEGSRFVVHADGAQVEVLGTEFNVRSYGGEKEVAVVVRNGRVAVRPTQATDESKQVILTAGQMSRVSQDGKFTFASNVDLSRYIGWVNGRLRLENQTFRTALSELERWYNLECTVADTTVLTRRVTASFSGDNMTEALNVLSLLLDLTYERSGNYVTFYQRPTVKK